MKAIIFDLDGVIVSTDAYHFKAWKMLADRLGIPFTEKDNDRQRGVSRMESLEVVLEKSPIKYTQEEKIALATEKNENYVKSLEGLTEKELLEGVSSTLRKLRTKGLILAIGSSSKNTRLILNKIGLGDFFDAIADGNDIKNSKPNPEVFLKAAEKIGQKPCDCLVVEDAEAGVSAAKAGGFYCAGIGGAKNDKRVDYALNTFSDLLKIFDCVVND